MNDTQEDPDEIKAKLKEVEAPTRKKSQLIFLIVVITVIPALVLFVSGLLAHNKCGDREARCFDYCVETYRDDTRRFQSQLAGERICKRACEDDTDTCTAQATAVIGASCVLIFGTCCSSILVYALEAIVRRFGESTSLGAAKPRSAYFEPIYTEYEKREMAKTSWKPNFLKTDAEMEEVPLDKGKCRNCNILVEIDARWLTNARGGREGAICPRCKRVIVGIL